MRQTRIPCFPQMRRPPFPRSTHPTMSGDFNQYDDKSALQMLREVGRLLLVLLARLLVALWRLLRKTARALLRLVCKALLALIDLVRWVSRRLRDFWNDNDTQEKLRKTRQWLRRAGQQTLRGLAICAAALWKALRWLGKQLCVGLSKLARATVYAILHIGPTLRVLGRAMRQGVRLLARHSRRTGRGIRKWWRRRQRAWRHFRQNKGFKGLLIDLGVWLKQQINNYIEEQPDEAPAEDLDEAEEESRRLLEGDEEESYGDADTQPASPNSGKPQTRTFGRGIYNAMKHIVEDD